MAFDTEFTTYARPDLLTELAEDAAADVVYTTLAGVATNIGTEAIIGDEFEVPREVDGARGREFRRILTISLATITDPALDAKVTVNGTVYDILGSANKGSGMVDLTLVRFTEDYVHGEGHHDRRFT